MTARRMILCLGPHRSGTSTMAAALQAMGADLRLPDVYANDENAKGFFEHPEVLAFDDRLMAALGGAWDVPQFDCAAAMAGLRAIGDWRAEAVQLVRRVFDGAEVAALKDPRHCVLLPFWVDVLREAGFARLDFVHVLRDPVEVALSQKLRQAKAPEYYEIGRDLAEGAALWLTHSCRMWDDFDAGRHVLIAYDRLVDAPEAVLGAVAAALDLTPDPARLAGFVADFIDPSLRRSRVTEADRAEVRARLPQAGVAYDLLAPLADGHVLVSADVAGLGAVLAAPQTEAALTAIMAPVAARLSVKHRAAGRQIALLQDHLDEAERASLALRDEAHRVETSLAAQLAEQIRASAAEQERLTAEFKTEQARIADATAKVFAEERQSLQADFATQKAEMAAGFAQRLDETARAYQAEQARVTGEFQAQIATLQQELEVRGEAINQKIREIDALFASRSWRITAPVRAAGLLARRGRGGLGRLWIKLNHAARRGYRGVAAVSPGGAEALRRVLAPALHLGNRRLLQRDFVPAAEHHAATMHADGPTQLAYQRPGTPTGAAPLVTVLVPNYNHAAFLRQRLDSVFAQTYPNFEVILMDDCSSDDSRAILEDYARRFPDKARLMFNEVNSGGPFFQWEKGIRAARGELIWVAESDDWCSDNFLETLVPFFANDAVQLAYAPSLFMNSAGTEQTWTLWDYLADLGPDRWRQAFVLPAPVIVREAFAAKNIIPNVSSAVFRRPDPDRLAALDNAVWRGMRICGDWVFYLNLIRGGLLAYSPAAVNYYRQHAANTSVGSFAQDRYYAEHQIVAETVQRHYRVDPAIFARQRTDLIQHWLRNRGGLDQAAFDACYSLPAIMDAAETRKPNLMMAGYAFCAGGGETFPIALANLMKTAGYTVTYLNCDQEPAQPGIRDQLARDIPVVSNFEDLVRIVRDFDIEVIHSHHAWVDNTVLDLLPEDGSVKTVITLHGMYETIAEPQLKRMMPRLIRRTARMVYIADKNTEAMTARGAMDRADMVRIDNALPRGAGVAVPRADLGIPGDAFVLTVVSRGIPEKGWDEAIRAVTQARDLSGRDIHLIILGDGPEYDRLAGSAPAFVHFVGFRANTRDYFATADLGFLPSRFKGESFPLVLIDCLNAGRPMLASDLGEVRAMLSTDQGLAGEVFALENWQVPIAALAGRIAALACNPQDLAQLRARVPAASAKFDPERMKCGYDAVYLAAARRPAGEFA